MKSLKSHIILLFSLLCIFGLAQKNGFQDSLNKAELLVYENPEKAIEMAQQLQSEIDKKDYRKQISLLLLLGNAYSSKQNYQKSLEQGFSAYELAKKNDDAIFELKVLGFIANQYYVLQLDDKVDFYLDKSEKVISQAQIPDSLDYVVANTYFVRALNYKDKLDCNFAINYFNKAIAVYERSDYANNKINLPITYIQKGYCFFDQKQLDSADYSFRKAYEISVKNQVVYNKSHAQIGISKILSERKNYTSAIDTLIQVEKELETSSPLSLRAEVYKNISDNFLRIEDYKNYKKYSDSYLKIKKEMDSLEVKFVENIMDSQISNADDSIQKEKNKMMIFGSILIISLVGMILFVIMRTKRIKS